MGGGSVSGEPIYSPKSVPVENGTSTIVEMEFDHPLTGDIVLRNDPEEERKRRGPVGPVTSSK